MKELKELVSIVNKQGIKKLDLLTPSNKKGKLFDLYEGIRKGIFQTDEEAFLKIYGESVDELAYRKLKSRLQRQLMNTIVFADTTPGLTPSGVAFALNYRSFNIFAILIGKAAYTSAYALGRRLLNSAMKFETTELCMMVAPRMRIIAERMGDKKKFEYYNNLVHKYQRLYEAELIAAEYEQSITIHYTNTRSAKTELAQIAKRYTLELKKYTDVLDSSRLYLHAYNVFLLGYEIAGEFEKMMEACEEVVTYFENKRPRHATLVFFFLFKTLSYYVKGKQFKAGEKAIQKAITNLDNLNGRNYFITIEQYILLAFHCKKYHLAYEQYYSAISQQGFGLMVDSQQEHWKIYEAYLEFLKLTGNLNVDESQHENQFRLGKFLNEVPIYSKDKMGFNATILVVQFAFLLQMKKIDVLIDREDGLRVYAYRYLRKKETMRSFFFVKMLLEITDAQLHKEAVIRKADKYLKKMKAISPLESTDAGSIEIIPYEDLWNIVLGTLETKFYRVRKKKTTKK